MRGPVERDLRREVEALLADLPEHWRLVPVQGKRPVLREWPHRSVPAADREKIGAWLKRWPDCALALVTGPQSGVLVVDVDAPGGDHAADGTAAFARLQEELGRLPETPCARTPSGGWHLFFAWPEGHPHIPNRSPALGIDLRASNGCVVLPTGSRTPGRQWQTPPAGTVLPDLPVRWRARVLPLPRQPEAGPRPAWRSGVGEARGERYAAAALRSAVERVAGALPGERNNTLFREAASLARLAGLDPSEIAAALTEAALSAGLPQSEVEATIRSALRRRT